MGNNDQNSVRGLARAQSGRAPEAFQTHLGNGELRACRRILGEELLSKELNAATCNWLGLLAQKEERLVEAESWFSIGYLIGMPPESLMQARNAARSRLLLDRKELAFPLLRDLRLAGQQDDWLRSGLEQSRPKSGKPANYWDKAVTKTQASQDSSLHLSLATEFLSEAIWDWRGWYFLSTAHQFAGRLPESLAAAMQCHRVAPLGSPFATEGLARQKGCYLALGRADKALELLNRLIEQHPEKIEWRQEQAAALVNDNRPDEAISLLASLCSQQPQNIPLHLQLGYMLLERNRVTEAERSVLPVLQASAHADAPRFCERLQATLRRDEGLGDRVMARFRERPTKENLWHACAVLRLLTRDAERATILEEAVALEPKTPEFRSDLAITRLNLGRYKLAWPDYEARYAEGLNNPHAVNKPPFRFPEWRGGKLAPGQTLLVVGEQGLGDQLLNLRFLPRIKKESGAERVIFHCSEPLLPLVQGRKDLADHALSSIATENNGCTAWCLLQSAPGFIGIDKLADASMEKPYLFAPKAKVEKWARRLQTPKSFTGRRIGVVWTGKSSQRRNPFRSVPLAQLAATLHSLGPVQLYSLYKGEHERDIAALPVHTPVTNLSPEIKDFADSAAILTQLDLLVTTCTSLAHLAGAMGIPTHLLLDSDPFWVWGRHESVSTWYPSIKLYRQPRPGDWASVLRELESALKPLPSSTSFEVGKGL